MIRFFFRRPVFPIICDVQDVLISAGNAKKLYDQICSIEIPPGEQLPVIDVTAEGWVLHTDLMVISPLTLKKRWTKKEVIELFNNSKTAKQAGMEYPLKSLSSKRFGQIVREIVQLILIANKPIKKTRKKSARR